LCNVYASFVFIDPQPAQARNQAGMYGFHVLATGVVPYAI